MKRDDKRKFRDIKRCLKRRGHKRNRQGAKNLIEDDPEGAHKDEYSFDRYCSQPFNGLDYDNTRKKRNKYVNSRNPGTETGDAAPEPERPTERSASDTPEV